MSGAEGETRARIEARRLLDLSRLKGRRPPPVADERRRYRGIVAYDGSGWCGWQRQHDRVSICEMMEAAIQAATHTHTVVSAAGRTDAGVHAVGQAFAFDSETALPTEGLRQILLHVLPPGIRVAHLEEAEPGWNPQRGTLQKLYRYRLLESERPAPALERVAWRVPAPLDLDAVRAGAARLIGRHDFRAFRNDPGQARRDEVTVRTIEDLVVERRLDLLHFDVTGPGFLYMMVRNVTAALVEVGSGRRDADWISALLASRDRREGPPPAPPQGLTLESITYADGFGAHASR